MLIAIDRIRFNYLYKYGSIKLDASSFIDIEPVKNETFILDEKSIADKFDSAIPMFEDDGEVMLLNVDFDYPNSSNPLLLEFKRVISIYPLTILGAKLLTNRLNPDFRIEQPIYESLVQKIVESRKQSLKESSSQSLLDIFGLSAYPLLEIKKLFEEGSKVDPLNEENDFPKSNNFLKEVMAYHLTPSFLPSGNVEFILKIGLVAMLYIGKRQNDFQKGPFYKLTVQNARKISEGNFQQSYKSFFALENEKLKESFTKVRAIITKQLDNVDVFKVSYYYFAFSTYLRKNKNDLTGLVKDIRDLVSEDKAAAAVVMYMLGQVFPFNDLYESIYILNKAPLLKSSMQKDPISVTTYLPIEEEERADREFSTVQDGPNVDSGMMAKGKAIVEPNIKPVVGKRTKKRPSKKAVVKAKEESIPFEIVNERSSKKVVDFVIWCEKGRKPRKNSWRDIIKIHFKDPDRSITYEEVMSIIESDDFNDKLLKTLAEKERLREFFGR